MCFTCSTFVITVRISCGLWFDSRPDPDIGVAKDGFRSASRATTSPLRRHVRILNPTVRRISSFEMMAKDVVDRLGLAVVRGGDGRFCGNRSLSRSCLVTTVRERSEHVGTVVEALDPADLVIAVENLAVAPVGQVVLAISPTSKLLCAEALRRWAVLAWSRPAV